MGGAAGDNQAQREFARTESANLFEQGEPLLIRVLRVEAEHALVNAFPKW